MSEVDDLMSDYYQRLYEGLASGRMVPIDAAQAEDMIESASEQYRGRDRFHHDFEWYSELDVTKHGTSRVSRHHSTEALMLGYAINDGSVDQWVPPEGEEMPSDVRDAVRDPNVWKFCWNKPAEYCTWKNVLGIDIPHDQWIDGMILAYTLSFPGKLSKVGPILGVPEDKKKDANGMRLIRAFSRPAKPTKARPETRRNHLTDPELWEEFKEYNRQDVVAERENWHRMKKWDLPEDEWAMFAIDQDINERGIPINMAVVRNAIRVSREISTKYLKEMGQLTGVKNPNAPGQLLPWLRDNGYRFEDLKKGHVKTALKEMTDEIERLGGDPKDEPVLRVLELRPRSQRHP